MQQNQRKKKKKVPDEYKKKFLVKSLKYNGDNVNR